MNGEGQYRRRWRRKAAWAGRAVNLRLGRRREQPHGYIGIAGLAAAVVALIAVATSHPIWPPKIVNTCSLVLFALTAVLGFTLSKNDDRWLTTCGGAASASSLG